MIRKTKIKHTVHCTGLQKQVYLNGKKKNQNTEFKQELYIKNAKPLTVNGAY